MNNDYREQIKSYSKKFVFLKTGLFGRKRLIISDSPSTHKGVFSRVDSFGLSDVSISDDTKSAKVYQRVEDSTEEPLPIVLEGLRQVTVSYGNV